METQKPPRVPLVLMPEPLLPKHHQISLPQLIAHAQSTRMQPMEPVPLADAQFVLMASRRLLLAPHQQQHATSAMPDMQAMEQRALHAQSASMQQMRALVRACIAHQANTATRKVLLRV